MPSCFRVAQAEWLFPEFVLSRSLQLYCPNPRALRYGRFHRVALSSENAQNDVCGFKCMHCGNGSWLITSPPTTTRGWDPRSRRKLEAAVPWVQHERVGDSLWEQRSARVATGGCRGDPHLGRVQRRSTLDPAQNRWFLKRRLIRRHTQLHIYSAWNGGCKNGGETRSLSTEVHACNSSVWEAAAGGPKIRNQPGVHNDFLTSLGYLETLSEKKNRSWRRDCFEFVTDFRHQQEEPEED